MKTQISITGQAKGNNLLKTKLQLQPGAGKAVDTGFNNFEICFETKQEARQALANVYLQLALEEPEMVNKNWGLYLTKDTLYYDASSASL